MLDRSQAKAKLDLERMMISNGKAEIKYVLLAKHKHKKSNISM